MAEKYRYDDGGPGYEDNATYAQSHNDHSMQRPGGYDDADVFGHEENHDVRRPHQAQV